MSASNSTAKSRPGKPYPGFPLFAHATGRWAKKIRGKLHYFGKVAGGHEPALERYLKDKDCLHAGLTPVDTREGLTVHGLCAKFLAFKKSRRDAEHLSPLLFEEYGAVCRRLIAAAGKNRLVAALSIGDFAKMRSAMEKKWGVHRITNEIVRVKTIFKFGVAEGILAAPPVFGQSFRPPSKKDVRLHRAKIGSRLFAPGEIRSMIDAAGLPMKPMVLLGINAALSNSDLANLPLDAIDLETGWLTFARVKTGIERRVPLWSETITAIREWIVKRPTPADAANRELVFLTRTGDDWRAGAKGSPLSQVVRKLMVKLEIGGARGFYSLRRTFQNVAEEGKDFLATRAIMAHATNDVSEFYREQISDVRLLAVTERVRSWLFAEKGATNNG